MKNVLSIGFSLLLFFIIVLVFVVSFRKFDVDNPSANNDAVKAEIGILQNKVAALETAAGQSVNPPDELNEAAKVGLTAMPGWQLQKIIEQGGDGSLFYQLSASTRQYAPQLSTARPLDYSLRSIINDELQAAKARRGKPK